VVTGHTVEQQGRCILSESTGALRLVALVLIAVGTAGLLANEFIAGWGRIATLASAGLNLIGLAILGYALMRDRKQPGT
jgi:hypothetical protein